MTDGPLDATEKKKLLHAKDWQENPYRFFEEVFGITYLTPDQHLLVDSYMTNRRTAVTSGNGTGKTWILARIVVHFTATNRGSICYTTGPSDEAVETLWREISTALAGAKIDLGAKVLGQRLEFEKLWYAQGIATNTETRLQGKHARRVLYVIDEATGCEPFVFVAGEGNAIGDNDRILAACNPTDSSCAFRQEAKKTWKWHPIVLSCLNHPNITEGREVIPGAVTQRFIDDMERDYGVDHPVYRARVKGEWSDELGMMFADFSVERHVYHPRTVVLEPWWPRWMSVDWGFRHPSAVYFYAWDGRTIYVYDEIVEAGLVATDLARRVGERANPEIGFGKAQKFEAIYLAHDAFNKTGETARSRAEMFNEEIVAWGLPAAQRASTDRIGGWNLITAMLRNGTLKVSMACPKLIEKFPLAVHDPKKPEDMLKKEGMDDELEALYKGVAGRPPDITVPAAVRIAQQLTATSPHDIAMQSRILASRLTADGDGAAFVSLRRGYR